MTQDIAGARSDLERQGWCVLPAALTHDELAASRAALDGAIAKMQARGIPTHSATLDPNAANIRVYNLPEFSPVFVALLRHPAARALVEAVLGADSIVSNFTANIARPGSGAMRIHSDQALVIPPPWNEPWAMNIIWCLDDVDEENGATRYVPGSQHWRDFTAVPDDVDARSRPFAAPAGSLIAMEGRVWHTSGSNVSADRQRRMMFAYYTRDFIRQQINWDVSLSAPTKDALDADARRMLGMGPAGNTRIGGALTRLAKGARPNMAAFRQPEDTAA